MHDTLELKTPCKALIRSFVPMDGVGELVTDEGIVVRFGMSASKGFIPQKGLQVWLVAAGPHPSGNGFRAKVVNLTGELEGDRLADLEAARQKADAAIARENALLSAFGMERAWHYFDQLLGLPPRRLGELAAALVALKNESHVFDRLFEELAIAVPEAFHPLLDEIDWRAEPQSLAWVGAPFEAVQFASEILEKSAAIQLIEHVPVGTLGPAHELARRQRSPANDVGAAVLVLMRSGHPQAVAAVEKWIAQENVAPAAVNALLIVAGWLYSDGTLHRLWGHRNAHRLSEANGGEVKLYESAKGRCAACRHPLLCLVEGVEKTGLPFSLFTCANCNRSDFDLYFVEVDLQNRPQTLMNHIDDSFRSSVRRQAKIHSFQANLHAAPWAIPSDLDSAHMSRIGGAPSWVQGPSAAGLCPKCRKPMIFAAQFTDPPEEPWSGGEDGILYAFICETCRITATFIQQY